MSDVTLKRLSNHDADQTLRLSYNDIDASHTVNGFLVGVVGRKVIMAISTTSIANDTETYAFSENGTALYSIKVIYTSGTRDTLLSAERVA